MEEFVGGELLDGVGFVVGNLFNPVVVFALFVLDCREEDFGFALSESSQAEVDGYASQPSFQ